MIDLEANNSRTPKNSDLLCLHIDQVPNHEMGLQIEKKEREKGIIHLSSRDNTCKRNRKRGSMSTVPIDEEQHHRRGRRGEAPNRARRRQATTSSGRIRGGWLVQGDAGNHTGERRSEASVQPHRGAAEWPRRMRTRLATNEEEAQQP